MIGFFPTPYQDELVYSWLARYFVWSGYTSALDAYRDLYDNPKVRPSVELMNNMTKDAREVMERTGPLKELVQRHTLFPEYARFMDPLRREKLLEECDFTKGNWNNNLMRPTSVGERYLRYCPLCVKEDREEHGETYWHRLHQISGMKVCVKHGVYLCNSSVLLDTKLTRLKAAEIVINETEEAVECKDETVMKLSSFMVQVFLSLEYSHDSIGRYLNDRIDPGYIKGNGERRMEAFYADYKAFYSSFGDTVLMSRNVMARILSGRQGLFAYVCQLALFEGITPEELLHDGSETEDSDIFVRVSKRTGESIDKVRLIGEAILEELKKDSGIRVRSVRQKVSLDKEDERLAPKVASAVSEMYGTGDKRPRKVTVSAVGRAIHIDTHKLNRMKRCMEAMKPYMETQAHYWAREIVWAVRELERRCEPLTLKRMGRLVSLKRREIESCMDELKALDEDRYTIVKSILG